MDDYVTTDAAARGERMTFLRAWTANPRRVAALAPSSRRLAALIARQVDPRAGPVVELGAGTGPVTVALLERGVAPRDLAVVESDPELAAVLRRRFPDVRVLAMDAAALGAFDLFTGRQAAAVISGIPVLTMPRAVVAEILRAAFTQLAPGAALFQYSYAWTCPVSRSLLDELGLVASRAGITLGNLPPALVYRIARREEGGPFGPPSL